MRRRSGRVIDCRKAPSHAGPAVGQEKFHDAFAAKGKHEVMSGHTRRRVIELAAGASVLSFGPAAAQTAQQWPPARIRFLVGTAPGGSPDVVGRLLAERLTDRWGTSVYVDNVTQAAGAVAYRTIARSVPDGSTMGIL